MERLEDGVAFWDASEAAGAASVWFAVSFLDGAVVTDEGGGADEVWWDDWPVGVNPPGFLEAFYLERMESHGQ
ncbi:MAG: hypothetical protein OXC98_05275 [bacterium]|nr:hypothetical protein [Acidimicrobiia bacterium]MCY4649761.1 hypothetical protein [bacterium]